MRLSCCVVMVISIACVSALSQPALAQSEENKPGLSLPDQLTPWAMEEIEQMFIEMGKKPDWNAIRADLDSRPNTSIVRYPRAVANINFTIGWSSGNCNFRCWLIA